MVIPFEQITFSNNQSVLRDFPCSFDFDFFSRLFLNRIINEPFIDDWSFFQNNRAYNKMFVYQTHILLLYLHRNLKSLLTIAVYNLTKSIEKKRRKKIGFTSKFSMVFFPREYTPPPPPTVSSDDARECDGLQWTSFSAVIFHYDVYGLSYNCQTLVRCNWTIINRHFWCVSDVNASGTIDKKDFEIAIEVSDYYYYFYNDNLCCSTHDKYI